LAGKLVAICGIDGSGKTLQCELLCRRAREAGVRVETISFPRYGEGFFGELIARYLRGEFGEEPGEVSPYLAALPFACDRWEAAPAMRAWLAEGALVVCNRYVSANLAHQGAKISSDAERRKFLNWLEQLEYQIFQLPRPDLQVLLDVPAELAQELILKKARRQYTRQKRDIHESDIAYQGLTREVYRGLAASPGWVTIECAPGGRLPPPEEIAEKVWQHVSKLI
jgi:dTMP kinase